MSDHIPPTVTDEAAPSPHAFDTLRDLLVGPERQELEDLRRRLEAAGLTAEEIAEHLPEAIALRAARDEKLARSLAPTMEGAIQESVRRRPEKIASAIYPILGPAIRKSIADTMAGIVNAINRAIEHSLSPRGIRWRLESWRTGVPYAKIVIRHALVYRVEQVFLVHGETGVLLAYAAVPDPDTADADIVSSMMTAIRDFVRDGLRSRQQGGLKTFVSDDITVLVEQGPRAHLAVAVRGQPPDDLIERMQETLETVHLEFADPLRRFDGDTAPFTGAVPLLEERLETVVGTDRRPGPRRGPRIAWGVAGVVVLLLAAWFGWSTWRWRAAMRALGQEPGIVVLEADRGLRRSFVAGLRDPHAADPRDVVAAARLDPDRITFTWEPYLSLEPRLVMARARAQLSPAAGVEVALAADTLRLTGSAAAAWVGQAVTASVPGVSAVDVSGMTPRFPDTIVGLRRRIEGSRIQFAAGRSSLPPQSGPVVADVAVAFLELEAEAARIGYRASLRVLGRTDSTGAAEVNRELSRERADGVQAALVARGVPRAATEAAGVGSRQPLPAGDAAEAARLNRSVSFEVALAPVTVGTGRSR